MTETVRRAALCGLAILLTERLASGAEVPARAASGQTLVVPEAELDVGEVFHIVPGDDSQIVVTSDALLQRSVAICRRAVGYFVRPFDAEPDAAPVVSGAVRIPLASLDSGSQSTNDLMRGPGLLNAGAHPEATFQITTVDDVRRGDPQAAPLDWEMTLCGTLAVAGRTLDMRIPATLTLHPFTFRTMNRTPGDLLTLRASFALELAELGLAAPDRALADRIAQRVRVDVFLLASVAPPDHSYDPRIPRTEYQRMLNVLTHIRDLNDPRQGYALGDELIGAQPGNAALLNELAAAVVNEDGVETRDLDFALRAASRACELAADDATMLATRARVHSKRKEAALAVDWQQKALAALRDAPPPVAEAYQQTLEQYRAAAGAAGRP